MTPKYAFIFNLVLTYQLNPFEGVKSVAPGEVALEALESFLRLKDKEEAYTMKPLSKEEAKYIADHYPVSLSYDEVGSNAQM